MNLAAVFKSVAKMFFFLVKFTFYWSGMLKMQLDSSLTKWIYNATDQSSLFYIIFRDILFFFHFYLKTSRLVLRQGLIFVCGYSTHFPYFYVASVYFALIPIFFMLGSIFPQSFQLLFVKCVDMKKGMFKQTIYFVPDNSWSFPLATDITK